VEGNKLFFGRGAIQLTWNYNYIKASISLTGSADTFCKNPDLVATVGKYAWGAGNDPRKTFVFHYPTDPTDLTNPTILPALLLQFTLLTLRSLFTAGIYFWMENLKGEAAAGGAASTSHIQALQGDFGGTLWNINGGLECPGHGDWHKKAVVMRINHYCKAATILGVRGLLSFGGCAGMQTGFDACTSATCPACAPWKQQSESQGAFGLRMMSFAVPTAPPQSCVVGEVDCCDAYQTCQCAEAMEARRGRRLLFGGVSATMTTPANCTPLCYAATSPRYGQPVSPFK
jgi:hypothetical protein